MNEKGVDLDGALDWLAKYNDEVLSEFQAQRRMLPSWDLDMDRVVNEYVERLAYCAFVETTVGRSSQGDTLGRKDER